MIGLIGATGTTGRFVARALNDKGVAFKCIVRDPGKAAEVLGPDVETCPGDLADAASLDKAFQGLNKLYLLCGHSPVLAEQENNAIEAAKRSGISHIVLCSGNEKGISPDNPSIVMQQHYRSEQTLMKCGLEWTISRPNFFMSTLGGMAEAVIKADKFITTLPPESVVTMIDPADIGECVTEMLTGESHHGKKYFLTGAPVTMGGVVEELTGLLGREIAYVQVSPEQARQAMEERGMPDWLITHVSSTMALIAEGGLAGETDNVMNLTGHQPRTLSDWLSNNLAIFGG